MSQLVGRFAPTPSGEIHVGNALCFLLAWLSAKKQGGRVILRTENLDTLRCPEKFIYRNMQDLQWLGLQWDEGDDPSYWQSNRTEVYLQYFEKLREAGLVYPCFCSRADIRAASAPHLADHSPVYGGRCARLTAEEQAALWKVRKPTWRMRVPAETVSFVDGISGLYSENLLTECGDFVVRRADLVFAYQLAVVVDDALMGVNEVVRARDLISSTPRQLYIMEKLGFEPPRFIHIPTVLDPAGNKMSKRDEALSICSLRERYTPQQVLGKLAKLCGLCSDDSPKTTEQLLEVFSWEKIPNHDVVLPPDLF